MKMLILAFCFLFSNMAFSHDFKYVMSMLRPKEDVIPKFFQEQLEAKRLIHSNAIEYDAFLPDTIDLRWHDSEVQKQTSSNCTAFGLVAAMENLLDGKVKLSENHLWSLYHTYYPQPAINAASENAITLEQYWPIEMSEGYPDFDEQAHYYLKSYHYLADSIPNAMKALAANSPVYLAFFVTEDVADCKVKPSKTSPMVTLNAGHVVEVVGYNQLERVIIIKNSWGSDCGEAGYQYIPYEYCSRSKMYCMMWSIDEVGEK